LSADTPWSCCGGSAWPRNSSTPPASNLPPVISVIACEVEVLCGFAPAHLDGVLDQFRMRLVPVSLDGVDAGNRIDPVLDPLRRPVTPGGLEHPGLLQVGEDVAVLIIVGLSTL